MIFHIDKTEPGRPALLADHGECITYGMLCRQVREIAALLDKRAVVICLCENTPASVLGYLAALESRAVPLLLDANLDRERIEGFARTYAAAWLWMPEECREKLAGFCEAELTVQGDYVLAEIPALASSCSFDIHPSLSLLLATSGSTGNPKLVRLSRENIESNAASIAEYLELTEDERPITTLPMNYTYGLSIIHSHLLAGACILMTKSSYVQQTFWDFFAREQATSFGGVPYTYHLLKRIHFFDKPCPGLRSMTQAGGHLPAAMQEMIANWARKQGIRFYIMYGQTEATARMSYLPPEKCIEKTGSIGIAIPGGRLLLADDDGTEIEAAGTVGELVYEGANVSLGYAQCLTDLALGDERQGRLRTGDMAKRDEEGYYYIAGRRKRFVKIYGVRVNLDACEEILRTRYPQADLACGGTDDHLMIYIADETAAGSAAAYLADDLHLNRKGFEAAYTPRIPRNDAGKVLYSVLETGKRE